jgi:hypothetical protein
MDLNRNGRTSDLPRKSIANGASAGQKCGCRWPFSEHKRRVLDPAVAQHVRAASQSLSRHGPESFGAFLINSVEEQAMPRGNRPDRFWRRIPANRHWEKLELAVRLRLLRCKLCLFSTLHERSIVTRVEKSGIATRQGMRGHRTGYIALPVDRLQFNQRFAFERA